MSRAIDEQPAAAGQSTAAVQPSARPPIVILVMLAAVSPVAINMFVPSIPSIAEDFDAPYAKIQLGLSLYLACMAAAMFVVGPVSDRIGRRPVLIASMALFVVGSLLCVASSNAVMFLLGRVIQAASATGIVLSRTIVRDVHPREKSASVIGYVVMAMAVAPMIGPAVGGIVDEAAGWRSSFLLMGAFGLVTLICTYFVLPETNQSQGQSFAGQVASWRELAGIPCFWLYTAASSFGVSIFFAFLGGGPAIAAITLELSPSEYGLWFAVLALGYMTGNFISGRFSQSIGIEPMVRRGAMFSLAAPVIALTLILPGFLNAATLFIPMLLIGIGNGMMLPNSTAAVISLRPEAGGAASGLLGSTQIGSGAVASIAGALAAADGQSPVGLLSLLIAIAAAALFFAVWATWSGSKPA